MKTAKCGTIYIVPLFLPITFQTFFFVKNVPSVVYTVFPRIVRARSINFSLSKLRAIIEGALYSRARSISNQHWLNKQMPY